MLPLERAHLESQLAATAAGVESLKQKGRLVEVERKKLELDVGTRAESISRLKTQQYQTRKNEEFRAIGHEIERYENEIRKLEDQELELMIDAEANSMPGLEILADNVRCTHGATSGQIDEDELFYLRTRGIPTKVAQRLLVTGFLDEVIQRLDHAAIAEHLHRLIEKKFAH